MIMTKTLGEEAAKIDREAENAFNSISKVDKRYREKKRLENGLY